MAHKAHKARSFLLTLLAVGIGGFLIWSFARQLFTRAVQGEAKLMMSYVHTLERVYRLEKKDYLYWDEYYGANQKGVDSCLQPESAAELGFLLPGCHREKAAIPRYAYRVVKTEGDRYAIEAKSGSDKLGRSVVCFSPRADEIWQSSQNMDYVLTKSCF